MSHAKILPVRLCAHPCELCAHPCARRGGAMTGPPALRRPCPARGQRDVRHGLPQSQPALSSTTLRARTAVKYLRAWAGQACCASAPLSALSWCTHPDAPPHMRASAAPRGAGRSFFHSGNLFRALLLRSLGPAPCPGSGAGQPHHARRLPRQATWLSAPGGQRQPG